MSATIVAVGRLGFDPKMQYTPQGTAKTTMSVAVNSGYGDKKSTIWMNVVAYGSQAENANKYLQKGSVIKFSGHLQSVSSYEKKDGTVGVGVWVGAHEIEFISGMASKDEGGALDEPEEF